MKKISKFLRTNVHINSTSRKLYLVLFTVSFAFIFLNFFEPFGLYYDRSFSQEEVFIELFIAILLAFVVLLLSQFVVRLLLKFDKFTFASLFFWFLLEAATVAFVWSIFDVFSKNLTNNFVSVWLENYVGYLLIMGFPYFFFVSYVHVRDTIKNLKNENSTSPSKKQEKIEVALKDENDVVRMVLKIENLLFIKSADNYIEVHFLENGSVSKSLLRTSIKKLETSFSNTPIIRCHRSFIVNTNNIELTKKTSSGYTLKLNQVSELTIPVSKSYLSEFRKYTQHLNN